MIEWLKYNWIEALIYLAVCVGIVVDILLWRSYA